MIFSMIVFCMQKVHLINSNDENILLKHILVAILILSTGTVFMG